VKCLTIRERTKYDTGAKRRRREKDKQQQVFYPSIEKNPWIEILLRYHQQYIRELVEFWISNGFSYSIIIL
jgi:hypothetical protein